MRGRELLIPRMTRQIKVVKPEPIGVPEQIQDGCLQRRGLVPMIRRAIGGGPPEHPLGHRARRHVVQRGEVDVGFVQDRIEVDGGRVPDIECAEDRVLVRLVPDMRIFRPSGGIVPPRLRARRQLGVEGCLLVFSIGRREIGSVDRFVILQIRFGSRSGVVDAVVVYRSSLDLSFSNPGPVVAIVPLPGSCKEK